MSWARFPLSSLDANFQVLVALASAFTSPEGTIYIHSATNRQTGSKLQGGKCDCLPRLLWASTAASPSSGSVPVPACVRRYGLGIFKCQTSVWVGEGRGWENLVRTGKRSVGLRCFLQNLISSERAGTCKMSSIKLTVISFFSSKK